MSETSNDWAVAFIPKTKLAEHRSHVRFPIRLRVEFIVGRGSLVFQRGFGRTVNISSTGVFVETKTALPANGSVKLLVNWPALLDGTHPLKLVLWGRIVRADGKGVGIKFTQHEFRTAPTRRPLARLSQKKAGPSE